jgi:hypothetical protein
MRCCGLSRALLLLAGHDRFGGWGYFGLDNGRARTSTAFDASRCQACHVKHADNDSVFTQCYPRLRDVNVGQSQGGD